MAEEISLEFIGAQLAEVLEGQRGTNERLDKLNATVTELQVGLAVTRTDLGIVKTDIAELKESAQIIEHDISGIKMRVERIERHTGLMKA